MYMHTRIIAILVTLARAAGGGLGAKARITFLQSIKEPLCEIEDSSTYQVLFELALRLLVVVVLYCLLGDLTSLDLSIS